MSLGDVRFPTSPRSRESFLTYLLFLKERGFLNASQINACKQVLPNLHARYNRSSYHRYGFIVAVGGWDDDSPLERLHQPFAFWL